LITNMLLSPLMTDFLTPKTSPSLNLGLAQRSSPSLMPLILSTTSSSETMASRILIRSTRRQFTSTPLPNSWARGGAAHLRVEWQWGKNILHCLGTNSTLPLRTQSFKRVRKVRSQVTHPVAIHWRCGIRDNFVDRLGLYTLTLEAKIARKHF